LYHKLCQAEKPENILKNTSPPTGRKKYRPLWCGGKNIQKGRETGGNFNVKANKGKIKGKWK
jgi:hypothetical protein